MKCRLFITFLILAISGTTIVHDAQSLPVSRSGYK